MSENETPTLKAFSLLECLAASDHAMSLTELARIMDLPKPSIHRHLAALEVGGLIIRDAGTKHAYTIGPRLTRLQYGIEPWRCTAPTPCDFKRLGGRHWSNL